MKARRHDHVGQIDWLQHPLIRCSGCGQQWFFNERWNPVPDWFEPPEFEPEVDPYKDFLRNQTPDKKPIKLPRKKGKE